MRSPLPNSVPSTRSAPAISPSSAVATAVPRSLCGCTERIDGVPVREMAAEPLDPVGVDVRRELLDRRRQVHDHLLLRRRPPLRGHALADLERVVELGVVEALRRVLEHDLRRRLGRELLAERRATDGEVGDPARSIRKTTRRCVTEVELYRCTIARLAPPIASYVRSISSGRACVSTAIVTSSGIRSCSTSERTKSKSVFEADGKPTSISLTPSASSRSKKRRLRAASIGLTSAWFPSRRSVEHQIGARSSDDVGPGAVGQRRRSRTGGICGTASAASGIGSPREDGLLPLGAGARERVCRRSHPLAGKEEGKREQAGAGRKCDPGAAQHVRTIAEAARGRPGKRG